MSDLGVIVVDMQDTYLPISNTIRQSLIDTNKRLLNYCAQHDVPVVALEYRGFGRTTKPIREALERVPRSVYYEKQYDNGFIDTPVEATLKYCGVKTVCLTGLNASACVMATASGALAANFAIVTASDLIANGCCQGGDDCRHQYGGWYKEKGVFYPSYEHITGGPVELPIIPAPESLWTRVKRVFL